MLAYIPMYILMGAIQAIVFVGVPLVPIIKWILTTRKQNLEDIETCESLKSFIDNCLERLKKNQRSINESVLYRIQDGIYKHRKTAFKIPDYLYNLMRDKQEKSIHTMINQYVHQEKKH